MDIISPPLPSPKTTEYTWEQTWRFFLLGLFRALVVSSLPLFVWVWRWYSTSYDPVNWREFWIQAAVTLAAPAGLYWKNHWHMLKLPCILEVPPEFVSEIAKDAG